MLCFWFLGNISLLALPEVQANSDKTKDICLRCVLFSAHPCAEEREPLSRGGVCKAVGPKAIGLLLGSEGEVFWASHIVCCCLSSCRKIIWIRFKIKLWFFFLSIFYHFGPNILMVLPISAWTEGTMKMKDINATTDAILFCSSYFYVSYHTKLDYCFEVG